MTQSRPIPGLVRGCAAVALSAASLASCASRWEPPTSGPAEFGKICSKRAPKVAEFGEAGVRAVYHFIVQDVPDEDLSAFVRRSEEQGFDVVPFPMNINGLDALFVRGRSILRTQEEVDAEFGDGCGLGGGKIYVTRVRYNSAVDDESGSLRVS